MFALLFCKMHKNNIIIKIQYYDFSITQFISVVSSSYCSSTEEELLEKEGFQGTTTTIPIPPTTQ